MNHLGMKYILKLDKHEKEILDWCEKNELNLNAKQSKALTSASDMAETA